MTRQERHDQVMRVIEKQSGWLNIVLGSIIDIGDSYMRDCIEDLRQQGRLKFQLKHMTRKTLLAYETNRRSLSINTSGCHDMYMDALDLISDEIRPHIANLYWPIKTILDNTSPKQSAEKARCAVSIIIMRLAGIVYEDVSAEIAAEAMMPTSAMMRAFRPVDPRPTEKLWLETVAAAYGDIDMEDIVTQPNAKMAIDVISHKLTDVTQIEAYCKRVIEEHPDKMKRYFDHHPEEREEYYGER